MWIKCLGSGVLLVCALIHCYQYERRTTQTKRILSAWIALLTEMKRQIANYGRPLPEILPLVDPHVVAVLEREGIPLSATTLPSICLSHAKELPPECGEILQGVAQDLGTVWRQEQVERLEEDIERLTQQKEAFCEAASGALRLRRALSLCGALGVILLVW